MYVRIYVCMYVRMYVAVPREAFLWMSAKVQAMDKVGDARGLMEGLQSPHTRKDHTRKDPTFWILHSCHQAQDSRRNHGLQDPYVHAVVWAPTQLRIYLDHQGIA